MLRNVEIRNLKEGTLYTVAQILDTNDDWKLFMSRIPKDLESIQSENVDPKYNQEHIRLIEEHSKKTGEKCAKILFDEWGTSGRVRPTLATLKQIAVNVGMLRVADEISRILGEDLPPRPDTGPGAPVNTDFSCMINESSSELTTGEKSRNNQTTAQMQSDNDEGSNNKLQGQTTAQMKSESDMIQFSKTIKSIEIDSAGQTQAKIKKETDNTIQGFTKSPMKTASNLIMFSEKNIETQASARSEEWVPNIPAWREIVASPHTLHTKAYGKSNQLKNAVVNADHTPTAPEADSSGITDYQQSLPNIDLFQSSNQIQESEDNLSLKSRIDKSILQDTNLIHFNYIELKAITNNFSETMLNGPYGICGKIGQGGFGEVFVGSHPTHGPLAIKKTHQHVVLVHKPEVAVRLFNSEVKYLSQFRHENIVPIIGFSTDGPALCIVCDYIDGGSLEEKLEEKVLNEKQRINIMQGTAEGLRYLHSYELDNKLSFSTSSSESSVQSVSKTNFVHRDVKTANILLTKEFIPKLCDFGLAKQYETTFITSAPMGTSAYMAPEGLYGTITQKIDIYSYGIVLLELLTGLKCVVQLDNGDRLQIKHYIDEAIKRFGKDITDFLDMSVGVWTKADEIYKLAKKCLEADRQDRPAVEEICEILHSINNK